MELHSAGSLYFQLAGPNVSFQLLKAADKIAVPYFLIFRFQRVDKDAKYSVPYSSK